MGEEDRMKRWRYLIPAIIFIVTVLGLWLDPYVRSWKIARLIDEAGRKGEPVIIALVEKSDKYRYVISDIKGQSVPLISGYFIADSHISYVTSDGTVKFLFAESNEETPIRYSIKIPSTKLEDEQPERSVELPESIDWHPVFYRDNRYYLYPVNSQMQILDLETLERREFDIAE